MCPVQWPVEPVHRTGACPTNNIGNETNGTVVSMATAREHFPSDRTSSAVDRSPCFICGRSGDSSSPDYGCQSIVRFDGDSPSAVSSSMTDIDGFGHLGNNDGEKACPSVDRPDDSLPREIEHEACPSASSIVRRAVVSRAPAGIVVERCCTRNRLDRSESCVPVGVRSTV
jgi:hypothetical protein